MFTFYGELKSWQGAIGSLLGFIALFLGAIWNAHLNRLRDDRLHQREVCAVAAALYGELILIRVALARLARVVARIEIDSREFSADRADMLRLPEPSIYRALASKVGVLPSDLVVAIIAFHAGAHHAQSNIDMIIPDEKRGWTYSAGAVLRPAIAGVIGSELTLRQLEAIAKLPAADLAVDLGYAEHVVEIEDDLHQNNYKNGVTVQA